MKTKRTLAALTAVMMCMSMAACGNTETKSSDPNDITASEAEERLKALDSMSDEEIDELFNGENETTTTTAATTTTTTTTTTAAPAVDPDIPYAYYDDLAEEYEKCGVTPVIGRLYGDDQPISFDKIQYGTGPYYFVPNKNGFFIYDYSQYNDTIVYSYNYGDKDVKQFSLNDGRVYYSNGDYAYAYSSDSGYFYRLKNDMKEDAKFKKLMTTQESYGKKTDYYYGVLGSVYGISNNGGVLLYGIDTQEVHGKEYLYYLESDFKTLTELPFPEEGKIGDGYVGTFIYNNKMYDVQLGMYLDIDKKEWHTFDNSKIKNSDGNHIERVIGKYIISEKSIYDMEKDKYVTTNLDKTKGSYYGGDSNIVVKGDKVYKTYVPVNPINVEGRPDELIMSGWDDKSCKILNYKYYLFKDEYGIFLREYGKDTDGEVTLIRF